MKKAKLFRDGRSQAVRLPQESHFKGDFVYAKRTANAVILLPAENAWTSLFRSLDKFSSDFMVERNQPGSQNRKSL